MEFRHDPFWDKTSFSSEEIANKLKISKEFVERVGIIQLEKKKFRYENIYFSENETKQIVKYFKDLIKTVGKDKLKEFFLKEDVHVKMQLFPGKDVNKIKCINCKEKLNDPGTLEKLNIELRLGYLVCKIDHDIKNNYWFCEKFR